MFQCGFCDFKDMDDKVVSLHWKTCKHRHSLDQGMTEECEDNIPRITLMAEEDKEASTMSKIVKGISSILNPKQQNRQARQDKCVVIGSLGEVGNAIQRMIRESNYFCCVGIDKAGVISVDYNGTIKDIQSDKAKMNPKFMHICIPYINQKQFTSAVINYAKEIEPEIIIIHSTVIPGTTRHIMKQMDKWAARPQLVYTPCRGQHSQLKDDFRRYDKWTACEAKCRDDVEFHFKHLGMRVIGFSDRQWEQLELSKLIDTSQYGILIMYAQIANRLASKYNVPYTLVRDFMSQTNELYNNRPNITPGYVGGKCVRQNIELLKRVMPHELWRVFERSNNERAKELGMSPKQMHE